MNVTLVAVVVLALFFDYTNGFHDAANAIATTVSTRALSPRQAVLMAGILNFAGAFISIKVATTVGKGIVATHAVTTKVVLAAVVGAIVWNLITWYLGLPTSSSHSLLGGVAGGVIAAAASSMAAGTYSGGWRIISTLGRRVTSLQPYQGFSAETATAGILYAAAHFGFPVSTTHTVTGSVLGAGAARRLSSVRWKVVQSILAAWLFTFPAAGLVGAAMVYVTRLPGGSMLVFALAVVF